MNKLRSVFPAILAVLFCTQPLLISCEKDRQHPVPDVVIDFNFNVLHYNLSNPGLSAQFSREESGGYRGIIVYRLSMDEFRAYDRACPHEPHAANCLVSISASSAVLAEDDCCGSVFILTDGSVLEGPSDFPLKAYRTVFNPATNRLRITN